MLSWVRVVRSWASRCRYVTMSTHSFPWLAVHGYGCHIKVDQMHLMIQRGGNVERYPIGSIEHLLILGGHTLHSSVVTNLLKAGTSITFFDPDGTPLGVLHPLGERPDEKIRAIQHTTPVRRYAVAIAGAAMRKRNILIEELSQQLRRDLYYEGESSLLRGAEKELEFLVKMDEVRRLYKLTVDMYYEILSRTIPPDSGFKRRTERPHQDPVNAMLSLGYAILFGACSVSVAGAHLDPDFGMLHEGAGGLVHDIAEALKPRVVDEVVFSLARKGIKPHFYECGEKRCYLSDELVEDLMAALHASVKRDQIDEYVNTYRESILFNAPFYVPS
jgi:CRISP-associated protein Cas1